ncbi:uncharacterized protein LOC118200942 [Stegodyphus dumicola]|uniref:uncharacterized protein LOC118200942 n=1 Tax=Stegodyphus dumicola TaxID=202533 RepID=UPI0015A7CEBF|nr:uncharacterized protein LOC118200942 [Stegodyphus dumicola]
MNYIHIYNMHYSKENFFYSLMFKFFSFFFQSLFPFIVNVSRWKEWDPLYCSKTLHVKSFQCQNMSKDRYMIADEVVETDSHGQSSVMYRFQSAEWENISWVLFWNVEKLEFMFFLMQPAICKNENVCLLTHIVGLKEFQNLSATLIVERMRNIRDMITLSQINILEIKASSNLSTTINEASSSSLKNLQNYNQELSSDAVLESESNDNNSCRVFMLVPILSHTGFKTLEGFYLMAKSVQPRFSRRHRAKESTSKYDKQPKTRLRRAASDLVLKPKTYATDLNRNSVFYVDIKDDKIGLNEELTKSDNHEKCTDTYREASKLEKASKIDDVKNIGPRDSLRSFSESALSNINSNRELISLSDSQEHISSPQYDTDLNEAFNVMTESIEEEDSSLIDEETQNDIYCSSVLGFEILDYNRISSFKIVDFVTQGNYGASELQAEVLLASQMYASWNKGTIINANGWFHYSTHKGIPVLSKTTSSQCLKISSFMCQLIIPVKPKDVWKFVKNPRFRFICDKTVKSVDIIEKISDSQKLIHTYHETSGIIWKEAVDLCLLQTEREEPNRYYSAFHSIEYDKCPFMNSVTRASLMPSGWVVEEDEKDPKRSKVTYLMQAVNISSGSLFIQELSTLVPESLSNLKNYTTSQPV